MKNRSRAFTSLLLFLGSIVLGVSGIVLFVAPKCRVASWTDWRVLGLCKDSWEAIHLNVSLLVLAVALFHLYFNWGILVRYVKEKSAWALNMKKEIAAATLIIVLFTVGSVYELPPFGSVLTLRSRSQESWESVAPRAPAPQAEDYPLGRLARTIDLSKEQITKALEEDGFEVGDRSTSLRELGEKYGVPPSRVYAAIAKHYRNLPKVRCGSGGGCAGCGGCDASEEHGDDARKPKRPVVESDSVESNGPELPVLK